MAEIKVTVFRPTGRKYFQVQWVDPITGKKKTRSSGTNIKREAERFAGKLQDDLNSGNNQAKLRTKWEDFRTRYEAEVVPGFAVRTGEKVKATFNAVERIIDPKLLASVNAGTISKFTSELRTEGLAEPSIKGHLAYLRSALNWAKSVGLIAKVPEIAMPKRTAGMKGRAITTEEFERMLAAVPKVVGKNLRGHRTEAIISIAKAEVAGKETEGMRVSVRAYNRQLLDVAESWRFLLRGLWWSGLRLGEVVRLHWTDDRELCVDFSGKYPMFRIKAEAEKGHKDRLLPMAPEFSEFLRTVPEDERAGFVFDPMTTRSGNGRLTFATVSEAICEMGKVAKVKVAENKKGRVKYASAHDLRRAFGFRWSQRVMPAVLQQMMRHESIQTTMEFYVGKNSEAAAEAIWSALANTLANTSQKPVLDRAEANSANSCESRS